MTFQLLVRPAARHGLARLLGSLLALTACGRICAQETPPASDQDQVLAFPDRAEQKAPPPSLARPPAGVNPVSGTPVNPVVQAAYKAFYDNRFSDAERLFLDRLKEDPRDKTAAFGLGTVYIKSKNYLRAEAILSELAEKNPSDYHVLNNLAWLHAVAEDPRLRDGRKAVNLAQDALLLRPVDHHVWSTLAESYYVSGDYEKALRASRQALALAREQKAPETSLSEYLVQMQKCQQAAAAMSLLD